jgi:probable rRNA maturation factor
VRVVGAKPRVLIATLGGPHPLSVGTMRARAVRMMTHLGLEGAELSLTLVDDETMRALNREHRKKNKPTDVLSFPQHEGDVLTSLGLGLEAERAGRYRKRARGARVPDLLGDVVLSVPTATRQAEAGGRPLLAEATMLLAHGLLHLVGYDHRDDHEEAVMTARTRELEGVAAGRARAPKPSG